MKLLPNMFAPVMLAVTLGVCAAAMPTDAQSSTIHDRQTTAGGKMEFDVASVKQNVSGAPASNNLDWNDADPSTHTGGLFSATDFTLGFYIAFAYKLSFSREHPMEAQLPKWATTAHFDVDARGPTSTTKDQMRLMMQSLLADRFKLAVHWEKRQIPVYGLVLDKPGKRGPQLTPYSGGPNCVASTASPPSAASPSAGMTSDRWFMPCGDVGATRVNGEMHIGGRNLPMEQIANFMQGLSMGVLDRPVVDQTGLSGTFDLRIGFTREPNGPAPTNAQPPEADAPGTTFLEALKEQLGLSSMKLQRLPTKLSFGRKLPLVAIHLAAVAVPLVFGLLNAPRVRAQSPTPDWRTAAGGKMAFDVASVKRSKPGPEGYRSNFPLTLGSNLGPVGGLMSVDVPLRALIGFAFKLSAGQTHFLISGLPDWVDSEWFDIEARAPINNPSKDQFRLMVQLLLADRFKMAMHEESRQLPIYALVLTRPGRTGPQLRPHVDDAKCGAEGRAGAPPAPAEFSPFPCGATVMGVSSIPGRVRGGGRDVGLDYIAAFLTGTGFQGTAPDRTVVNQTGLTGEYDFWIEFVPDARRLQSGAQSDPDGLSFPEALQDQLGLKLMAKTGPIDVLIVDHIEEPSPN